MKIQQYWYRQNLHLFLLPLVPLSWVYGLIVKLRRFLYRSGIKKTNRLPIPTIVVGNITLGGTGKTPFVMWLVDYLKSQGKTPGIALRGVGGRKHYKPIEVAFRSNPYEVGDEAVLLAQNTFCPVVTCIDRAAAVNKLIELDCDIAICDDGLQHYGLDRDIEIAIVDASRYFGNHRLLPAGPLREPINRLKEVDIIVVNQPANYLPDTHNRINNLTTYPMRLEMETFVSIYSHSQQLDLSAFSGQTVHAIAGIGNPQRFFAMLNSLGIDVIPHVFPDHHQYQLTDLDFKDSFPIIMTEKDAIKCRLLSVQHNLNKKHLWYLRVNLEVGDGLKQVIQHKISNIVMHRLTGLRPRMMLDTTEEET
ncbi:MAG TPA: tetraacyldisaccharide 4'-kinase [Gammaproteobacteria bacterium]|nr:tetraacyldisaccharide 4'-kinase [Gammaproteobacteria bacterium]